MKLNSTKELKNKIYDWIDNSDDYKEYLKTGVINNVKITTKDIVDHYYDNFEDKYYHYTLLANRLIDEFYFKKFERVQHKDEDLVQEVVVLDFELENDLIDSGLLYEGERLLYFLHGFNSHEQDAMIYFADYELDFSSQLYNSGRADMNGVVVNFGNGSLYREDLYGTCHVVVIDEIMDYRFIPLWRYLYTMVGLLDSKVIKEDILRNESNFRVFLNIVLSNEELLNYFQNL